MVGTFHLGTFHLGTWNGQWLSMCIYALLLFDRRIYLPPGKDISLYLASIICSGVALKVVGKKP